MREAEAASVLSTARRSHQGIAGLRRPGTASLLVVLSGAFMVVLDFFIVMVALPSIRGELGASGAQLQLIVSAYGVANAVGLITGGRLGDRYGRRRMYSLGLLMFILASAACAASGTPSQLVAARIAQGLAGALLQPQVLAILGLSYQGRGRVRAFAAYAVAMGLAGVLGQVVGGAVLSAHSGGLGWRACFLVNVPIGLVAFALTPRLVPRLQSRGDSQFDLVGSLLLALLLTALVTPLVEGREQGWPGWSAGLLLAVPALALVLLRQQRRLALVGGKPLLAPELLRTSGFATALGATLLFYFGTAAFYFVLALYLQQGLGMSPLASGAMFAVLGAGFFGSSMLVHQISAVFAGRHMEGGALLLALAHLLQAALVLSPTLHWMLLMPLLLAQGAGFGMVMAPLASIALVRVPSAQAGLASGLLASVQQVGNSVGVALIGLLFYGALGPRNAPAQGKAFATSLLYLAILSLVLTILLRRVSRSKH